MPERCDNALERRNNVLERWDMSNGHKLSGSGGSSSQPKTFPPGGISSDSKYDGLLLTVENVKKLEEECTTPKEVLVNQKVEEYIKQTNLSLLERARSRNTSREFILDETDPKGVASPTEPDEKTGKTRGKASKEISKAECQTDSPSTLHVGSKSKESKKSVDSSPTSPQSRKYDVKDLMTQTEWGYSAKSLDAHEDVFGEEVRSTEVIDEESVSIQSQDIIVIYTNISKEIEEKEEEVVVAEAAAEKSEAEEEESTEINYAEGREEYEQIILDEQAAYSILSKSVGERTDRNAAEEEKGKKLDFEALHELIENLQDHRSVSEGETSLLESKAYDGVKTTTLYLKKEHGGSEREICEFCSGPVKPFPEVEDLSIVPLEKLLCCRTYKTVFECVIKELLMKTDSAEEIDISPHPHLSQVLLLSETKKKLEKQLQDRGFEIYREIFQRYMKFAAWTKISFALVDQKDISTVGGKHSRKQSRAPEDMLELDTEIRAEHLKNCHAREPVRRYYPDGQIFSLLFPDGTGQVYYPSGNIAILITDVNRVLFTYVILEDNSYTGIRAFFTPHGYATCYHQNRLFWMILDFCFGSYFDKKGVKQKHWHWHDFSHHVHAPPFQPISMKLNVYISIKVVAQDQIYLSFAKDSNSIHFNMGARLKLKEPATLHFKPAEDQLELFLHSKSIQIKKLLAKMQNALQDWHRAQVKNIQGLASRHFLPANTVETETLNQ
ncbi:PREDICTED: glutamate-rich protein 6B isoform X1 [Crocodylus porosus]|uniref:glutamate-rich protein 6B isoform X1 n=2 Tax=Crocodylus porosus TaxID=8502 RepID=UPI00093B5AFE|nr:PREDICTED: glutamate-rich protein 6B isoform X1 [Crocodylus porosus]